MGGIRFDFLKSFVRDERGNLAVIFAIAIVPLLAAVGCAIDYSIATRIKSKLQSAADAAAVGAVAQGAPAYLQAGHIGSTGSLSDGVQDADNIFDANIYQATGFNNLQITASVTKNVTNITSQVSFSADVPTNFVTLLGYPKLTVTGSSQAAGQLPMFLDFYMMLDVSGSMGLPSTPAEETRLSQVNPDNYTNYPTGCTFACHFTIANGCGDSTQQYSTSNYCLGYLISRISQAGYKKILSNWSGKLPSYRISNLPNSLYTYNPSYPNDPALSPVSNCASDGTDPCIQLRLDAVGYALTQLFVTANNSEKVPQQFRIGLYPFIRYLYSYFPLTTSINGDPTNSSTINYAAANLATQLDTNASSNLGSGGTHIDTAFSSMNTLISTVGNGSASNNTQPFIFLITDGAQDNQVKGLGNANNNWSGSNHATVINPTTVCTPLKNRGINIAVLYIPYQAINPVNSSFANDEDDYANNNIPSISPSLQACASPGFFYTANTPADINNALQAMFNHALLMAHITN